MKGPLRWRLFLLAAVGVIPVAAMSGFGLYALLYQQRVQVERVGLEFSRALAIAVDAELRQTIAVLDSLATSVALDRDELSGFETRAKRPRHAAELGGRDARRSLGKAASGYPLSARAYPAAARRDGELQDRRSHSQTRGRQPCEEPRRRTSFRRTNASHPRQSIALYPLGDRRTESDSRGHHMPARTECLGYLGV